MYSLRFWNRPWGSYMEGPRVAETPYFLVYQMGKVGSTSMTVSLQEEYGPDSVKHTHNHDEAGSLIYERAREGRPVVVITGFREPLARCISAYFQTFSASKNKYWFIGSQDEILSKSCDWLIADFNSKVSRNLAEVVAPWLMGYQKATGISAQQFECKSGVLRAAVDGITCYVYKLESISDFAFATSTEAWIGDVKLQRQNDGGEKWSGDLYRDFKANFRITRSCYNAVYGGLDYVKWLYSDAEIEQLTANYVSG